MEGFDPSLLGPLINGLWRDLQTPRGWWGLLLVAVCLAVAWLASNRLERKLAGPSADRAPLAREWTHRVAWPLLALVLIAAVRPLAARTVPVYMLTIAMALLASLVVIRTVVLLIRQTFGPDSVMASFERTISVVVWLVVALHILDLLPLLVDALEEAAIPLGKQRLSVLQILTSVVTVWLAWTVALWASRALDSKLTHTKGIDEAGRAVVSRIAKPLFLIAAVLIALPIVGIDLTTLSVFGGALGVGLGLGLQRIAANYVSGFIILLDHSITPGRMIRIDKYRGTVIDIHTRYTVLKGMDGVDSIVPNEMLVSSVVESETFSDPITRFAVQVGVAYGSDVERAMALMVEAVRAQPRVIAEPPPMAFLVAFADSSINLEVGFWIRDPQAGTLALRSDINLAILRGFRDAGIEIPFPQREVTVRRAPLRPEAGALPAPEPADG